MEQYTPQTPSTKMPAADKDELYVITPIPDKGQGLVASVEISKGTRILAESPLFTLPSLTINVRLIEDLVIKKMKSLSKTEQRAVCSLHNAHRGSQSPFVGILKTNALPLGSGATEAGLFPVASRINHACIPNCQNTWNTNLHQLTIHAVEDIGRGEEITICYLDGSESYSARQLSLNTTFGFACTCKLCSLPPAQRELSDRRQQEISRLDNLIGDGSRIVSAPLTCLRDTHMLLHLLEEEGISDARIPRLYYDAFQVVIANGDQARGVVFAQKAYATRVICEGEDSPEAIRLRSLVERPAEHRLFGTAMRWKQSMKKIPQGLTEEEFENWLWRKTG